MRDIKFRVPHYNLKGVFVGFTYWGRLQGDSFNSPATRNDGIIKKPDEQYTGLKDKNGIEIYEGDIIEWFNAPGMISTEGSVFFNSNRGCWYIQNDLDNIYDELYNVFDYSIVIGNIHQNE